MPVALSKKPRPPPTIRPSAGRTSPASDWSVSVWPAPEGPKSATTFSPASQVTSSENPGSAVLIERESISRLEAEPRQPAETHEEHRHARHCQERQRIGLGHAVLLNVVVDGERQRLGEPRDAPRHHQRDAEVPQRAAEGEHRAGHHRAPGQRQTDGPEDAPLRAPERARGLLEPLIHRLEPGLRGLDEERDGADTRGKDGGPPSERQPNGAGGGGAAPR